MPTIKDVAKLAKVSPTTVSIVINGKAKERSIPDETCKAVFAAMDTLNYRPNLNARRLRSNDSARASISLFWPLNYLNYVMASVLSSLLQSFSDKDFHCQLTVESYDPEYPESVLERINFGYYDLAIIGCAPVNLIEKLDAVQTSIPVVFFNRESASHSFITSDTESMMKAAANAIYTKGYRDVGIFTNNTFASERRLNFFKDACLTLGINVADENIIVSDQKGTLELGATMMNDYLDSHRSPKVIFSNSDAIAIGALNACYLRGVHVPDDMEIISVELMDSQFSEHSTPPLTTIAVPTDQMCIRTADYIIDTLTNHSRVKLQRYCDYQLNMRKSFVL